MGGTQANKTDADRIAVGLAAGIMLWGLAVPLVKLPLNILLATKSCPRISCSTTLATTTLQTFSVPSRVWQIIYTPLTVQRLPKRSSRCKRSRSRSMTSRQSKRTLPLNYPSHSQAERSTCGNKNTLNNQKNKTVQ